MPDDGYGWWPSLLGRSFMVVLIICSSLWALHGSSLLSFICLLIFPMRKGGLPMLKLCWESPCFFRKGKSATGAMVNFVTCSVHITIITVLNNGSSILHDSRWVMLLMILMDTRKRFQGVHSFNSVLLPQPQISVISSGSPTAQEKITFAKTKSWNIGWEVGVVSSDKYGVVWVLWLIRNVF